MTTEAEIRAALDGHYYQMRHGIDGVKVIDLATTETFNDDDDEDEVIPDLFPRKNKGGRPNTIDWSDKDDIILAMRRSGALFRDISKVIGIGQDTVRWRFMRLCDVLGIDQEKEIPGYRKFNPQIESEIVVLRNEGHTFVAIGKRFGLSKASVHTLYYRWYRRTHKEEAA